MWKGSVEKASENDRKPRREIRRDPDDPKNIVEGKWKRIPKVQFYMGVHQNIGTQAALHAEFF